MHKRTHILTDSHADTHMIWVQTLLLVGQLCPTLCNPVDYIAARPLCPWNFPGKNAGVHSRFLLQGNFPTGDRTWVSCFGGRVFTIWAIREALGKLFIFTSALYSVNFQAYLSPDRSCCAWWDNSTRPISVPSMPTSLSLPTTRSCLQVLFPLILVR